MTSLKINKMTKPVWLNELADKAGRHDAAALLGGLLG